MDAILVMSADRVTIRKSEIAATMVNIVDANLSINLGPLMKFGYVLRKIDACSAFAKAK
ncbi:hypothetical protein [Nonlabens sp. Hel1_33_55]|uniref:hypothetical protein n=1 Tax=Nonlabens sp. Hel1_33_55 TaxID=1336802 RepID=UPI0015615849|nr:hypothetical protein [Nonlabens sp. Hel1_33_55]